MSDTFRLDDVRTLFRTDVATALGAAQEAVGRLALLPETLSAAGRPDQDAVHAWLDVAAAVHALKGTVSMLGLKQLAGAAGGLEDLAEGIGLGVRPVIAAAQMRSLLADLRRAADAVADADAPLADSALADLLANLPQSAADQITGSTTGAPPASNPGLDQVLADEASDLLERMETTLGSLSAAVRSGTPAGPDLLAGMRRDLHTLKGALAMAGHTQVATLVHAAETLIDAESDIPVHACHDPD